MKSSRLDHIIPKLKEKNNDVKEQRPSGVNGIRIEQKDDKYLQIDGSYSFKAIDENYLENINNNIGGESDNYDNIYYILSEILKKINISYEDVFDYSLKLSKKYYADKNLIEIFLDVLLKQNQSYNLEVLILNNDTLNKIGKILSFAYNQLDSYKIRNYDTLLKKLEKAKNSDVNIYIDYSIWSSSQKKANFTTFFAKHRKKYELPPEILILINTYEEVKTIIFEIDDLKSENFHFFELAVLNLHLLLNSLTNIKFNFIWKKIEQALFNRKKEKYETFCSRINSNFKPFDIFFNDISYLKQKWDFSHKLKFYNTNEGLKTEPLIEDFKLDQYGNRLDIIRKNANLFEYILMCFFSLNFYNTKNINFELIMNNSFSTEYYLILNEIYQFEWAKKSFHLFHIFDVLLFNNLINNIKAFNTEINSLDDRSFKKIMNFLYYNNTISSLNMSFFSADLTYIPQSLYMIYSESFDSPNSENGNKELKKNFDENTYLFCEIKEIEDKILEKLFKPFVDNLAALFEIIKSKHSLEELGFNFDVPFNIRNKSKYMNAIFKFILNIIFYVSKQKIKKFCLISPYTTIDPVTKPGIDSLINNINFKKNKYYEELTLQMQFYNMESITSFLNSRLINLNLGNMDLYTFKTLCNYICKHEFVKSSSLKSITIGLMESINEFTDEIKFLFRKLFGIKINNLYSLNLFTGLCLSDKKQYIDLLEIINYNWIIQYLITLDDNSKNVYKKEKNELLNLRCLVPIFWEKKLEEHKNKKNRNKAKEIDYDIYCYLKYLFNNKYKPYESYKPKKPSERNKSYPAKDIIVKKILFDILKYLYVSQIPKVFHDYQDINKI